MKNYVNATTLFDLAHLEAQQVLPWLANGTLSSEESERLHLHLHGCAECRADLAELHALREIRTTVDSHVDPEPSLIKLLSCLNTSSSQENDSVVPRWRDSFPANDRSWLRVAIVAQFGVISVLGFLLARGETPMGPDKDVYHVLGASDAASAQMVVMFKPETPERELRRIMGAHGVRIVNGPTMTNAWLLDTDDRMEVALAGLRSEPSVTLAEPLAAEGGP